MAFLGFFGFAVAYCMRFNLSIAIVAMVGSKKAGQFHKSPSACAYMSNDSVKGDDDHLAEPDLGEFHHWTEAEQGFILGSFFWGYVLTQLPGGILADKYGGKWPLGLGLLFTAVFAILSPICARTHTYLLIFCRVMQGLGQGLTVPAMHEILAHWAPPDERSQLAGIVYAGAQFGTAVTMVGSGYLIHAGVMGGWPSVFYVMGGISFIWFIFWTILISNKPSEHPRISEEELNYIQESIGDQSADEENASTPWFEIFTSLPVWAIIVGHVGHAWGLYTLLTELPTYLSTVLQFDIKDNSWLSAFPHLVMWIVSLIVPRVADYFISNDILSTVVVRKSCQSIAHLGAAVMLIAASYSGCYRIATMTFLTIAVGINGTIYAGFICNHVDLAPRHAGILMGITNTFATLTGFGAP
ncbi:putative inorganic phosphate cotransporter [Folsomia candida]|uniref:putative inorganic phosphate cotransporter n=1 Tax=Folsomia candida TaxID=158441 RepID=UPI0016054D55|nr:putative inorganic phosphate cotransporter [Folsomia candida]XP_035701992.1 putative inorganic phosphate cotransporter [Folsomia candida]